MADEEVLHAPKNQAGWTGTARAGVALPDAPGGEAVRAAETSHTGVLRATLWPCEGGAGEAAGDPAGAHRGTQRGGGAGGSRHAPRMEPGRFLRSAELGFHPGQGGRSLPRPARAEQGPLVWSPGQGVVLQGGVQES